eukprot:scaffold3180_cov399-Prasinococcus_capsulatus_cf.AAC.6
MQASLLSPSAYIFGSGTSYFFLACPTFIPSDNRAKLEPTTFTPTTNAYSGFRVSAPLGSVTDDDCRNLLSATARARAPPMPYNAHGISTGSKGHP